MIELPWEGIRQIPMVIRDVGSKGFNERAQGRGVPSATREVAPAVRA